MEHAELIEGAFVNCLSPMMNNVLVFPGENNMDKDGQRVVAYCEGGDLGDEVPPLTGNRETEVTVQLRTPFAKLTAKEIAANLPDPLDCHKTAASALETAVMALSDVTLTSGIAGFTCFGMIDRKPFREQQDNAWVSGWKVKIYSAPSSIAA